MVRYYGSYSNISRGKRQMDDVCCQLPINDEHLYRNHEYSWDEYIQA